MMTEPMHSSIRSRGARLKGYTLLEIVVALTCATVLLGIVSYAYLSYRDRAYRQLCYVLQTDLQKQIDGLDNPNIDGPMQELYERLVKADTRWATLQDPGEASGSWNHYFILPGTRRVCCTVHDTYDPASR